MAKGNNKIIKAICQATPYKEEEMKKKCPTCGKLISKQNDKNGFNYLEAYGECPECSLAREEDRENFNEMMSD